MIFTVLVSGNLRAIEGWVRVGDRQVVVIFVQPLS